MSEIRLREAELVAALRRHATTDIERIRTVPGSGGGWHGSGDTPSRESHS